MEAEQSKRVCRLVRRGISAAFRRNGEDYRAAPRPEGAEDKTPLQLATQLLKRWRDVHYDDPELAPISIVLTTLAGKHYFGEWHPLEALAGITARIVASLPRSGRVYVFNPAHAEEDLSERWDRNPRAYEAFADGVRDLNERLTSAPSLEGLPRLCEFLEDLFGDAATRAVTEQARSVEAARTAGHLALIGTSRGLSSTPSPGSTTVQRNTFYD